MRLMEPPPLPRALWGWPKSAVWWHTGSVVGPGLSPSEWTPQSSTCTTEKYRHVQYSQIYVFTDIHAYTENSSMNPWNSSQECFTDLYHFSFSDSCEQYEMITKAQGLWFDTKHRNHKIMYIYLRKIWNLQKEMAREPSHWVLNVSIVVTCNS